MYLLIGVVIVILQYKTIMRALGELVLGKQKMLVISFISVISIILTWPVYVLFRIYMVMYNKAYERIDNE